MLKKILFTLCIMALWLSCKEEGNKSSQEKENNVNTEKKIPQEKALSVTISFKTNKADKIRVVMNGIEIDEFQKKSISIIEDVEATTDLDRIVANFDEGNFSRNLMINLGQKGNKAIDIERMIFSYGTKEIVIDKQNYDKYLKHNHFVERDSLTNRFTIKQTNKKPFTPLIYSRQTLLNELINQ